MAMDKETLFKGILPEEDVELDRGTVRIRALTREEIQKTRADKENTTGQDVECIMMHFGLVEPKLDIKEARELSATISTKEWKKITRAIGRLSGMDDNDEDAQKSD